MTQAGVRDVASTRRDPGSSPEYLHAMRRGAPLLVALVVIAAASVYAITALAPKCYEAASLVGKRGTDLTAGTADVQALRRDLATSRTLVSTRGVLLVAAGQVPGETPQGLVDGLRVTLDPSANLIRIAFRDESGSRAARVASVVTDAFLVVRAAVIKAQLRTTATALGLRLRAAAGDRQQQDTAVALRRRIAALAVRQATVDDDLFVVEPAVMPSSALPSRALRNGAIALGVALLMALIAMLARQRIAPRAYSAAQVGAIMDLPVMSEIAHNSRRRGRRGRATALSEHEGYQGLRAALEFTGADGPPVAVLVTSAAHGEGKTTLAANLGRALQQAGHRTLLVAGDMRQPALHTAFEIDGPSGFSDVLLQLDEGTGGGRFEDTIISTGAARRSGSDGVSLIPPGGPLPDPGPLFTPATARVLFSKLRALPYDYVIIDTPHMTGFVDAQVLAVEADVVLIVARLGRVRLDALVSLRAMLDRLSLSSLGLVVLGTRTKVRPPASVDVEPPKPASAVRDAPVDS